MTNVSKYEHVFAAVTNQTNNCLEILFEMIYPRNMPERRFEYITQRRLIKRSGATIEEVVDERTVETRKSASFYLDCKIPIDHSDPFVSLEMHIQLTGVFSTDGDVRIPTRDFSLTDQFTDAVLLVEGKKFHVCKAALGWNSWYFKSLFTGGFDESNQTEVELKEVTANCVQHILECICGLPNIDENAVHEVLKMAELWQVPSATEACQKFLMEEENIMDEEKMELAKTYSLAELEMLCGERAVQISTNGSQTSSRLQVSMVELLQNSYSKSL